MNFAPIVIFAFKRVESLKLLIKTLQSNKEASESALFIFSDGSRNVIEEVQVKLLREYIKTIDGFLSVTVHESPMNKGLASSVIHGVTEVFKNHEKIIVLEDDLLVSSNFLAFMNSSLDFYEGNTSIFSISGFSFQFPKPANYNFDSFLVTRGCSWGWASWKDRWNLVDWEVKDYPEYKKDYKRQKEFEFSGSDLPKMLSRQMNKTVNSWAIRWYYSQYKLNKFTVYPVLSKVMNEGFDENATHTNVYNRYKTILDKTERQVFNLNPSKEFHPYYQSRIQSKFGLFERIVFGRLMTYIKYGYKFIRQRK